MYGYELSVTDASEPKKQIYQKCSATPDILKKHTAFIFNGWGLHEGSKRFLEPSTIQDEGTVFLPHVRKH